MRTLEKWRGLKLTGFAKIDKTIYVVISIIVLMLFNILNPTHYAFYSYISYLLSFNVIFISVIILSSIYDKLLKIKKESAFNLITNISASLFLIIFISFLFMSRIPNPLTSTITIIQTIIILFILYWFGLVIGNIISKKLRK